MMKKLALGAVVLFTAVSFAHAQTSLGLGNAEPGAGPSTFVMQYMPWLHPVNVQENGLPALYQRCQACNDAIRKV